MHMNVQGPAMKPICSLFPECDREGKVVHKSNGRFMPLKKTATYLEYQLIGCTYYETSFNYLSLENPNELC